MTTDGTTMTFPGEVPTQVETTETARPSPTSSLWTKAEKVLTCVKVSIDGSSPYTIPLPGQGIVHIELTDGRLVQLSGESVIIKSPDEDQSEQRRDTSQLDVVSFPVPLHIDGAKTVSRGSGDSKVSVTFNPPPPPPPGLPSISDALGGLADTVSDAADGIGSVVSSGQSLLESGSSAALDEFAGAIDSTLTSFGDIQSTITGLQQGLADDILAMADPDLKELIDTIDTIRDVYDTIQSVKDTINEFKGAVNTIKAKVQSFWPGHGYWEEHKKQLRDFAAFDWKSIKPGPEEAESYLIVTKRGTSWNVYQDFIKTLDEGKGYTQATEKSRDQWYWTTITASQARQAKKQNFIDWAKRVPPSDNPFKPARVLPEDHDPLKAAYDSASSAYRHDHHLGKESISHAFQRRDSKPRANSESYLKMISSNRIESTPPQADYTADDSLGKDQLIYVIDFGFDKNHPVSFRIWQAALLILVDCLRNLIGPSAK